MDVLSALLNLNPLDQRSLGKKKSKPLQQPLKTVEVYKQILVKNAN